MRKFVLIPVVQLGWQSKGRFLEIMSEPTCLGGINTTALKSGGLKQNIAETTQLLSRLAYQPPSADLYLTSYLANLSNTQGINLGLILACFMQEASCPYQKIIVTGQLDTRSQALSVLTTTHFETKIQTILNLGKQEKPTAFFFPQTLLTEKNNALLSPLASINIALKPINSLSDALLHFGITL